MPKVKPKMRILVLRFSALGDVALCVPIIQNILKNNPETEITFVSKGFVKPLFADLPIHFYAADLNGKHKGFLGLNRLAKTLYTTYKPDVVIDLHNVLRSRIITSILALKNIPVHTIHKGRKEKKALTRKDHKVLKPLTHTTYRYAQVFEKAGLKQNFDISNKLQINYKSNRSPLTLPSNKKNIGIAPLAKHQGKSWPISKVKALLKTLSKRDIVVYLFGGVEDVTQLESLKQDYSNIINLAGQYKLEDELCIMKQLNLMLAMDSSNMHMAVLAGIPVISVWGATHPYAGFSALGKEQDNLQVQISTDKLSCRPCSVFGNKPCFRGDYACLNWIEPKMVLDKIDFVLLNNNDV